MSRRSYRHVYAALTAAALLAGLCVNPAHFAVAVAAPPSPTPTPTPVPTPYMALELIPNGTWEIIIQGRGDPSYSKMRLKANGTAINGVWNFDKKTTYVISGVRDGAHLKLDIKPSDAPDIDPVGKIDATLDGIADMFGTITLNGVDMPFQGAQHSRVPGPVEAASNGPPQAPGIPGSTPYH
jgi:hypothetical protein